MPDTPGVLKYPVALDSRDSLIRFLDNATTFLEDPAVDLTDATFNADTSSFPATGAFTIEGEHVVYTGKTGTSFTGCLRGQFTSLGGLPAAKHPAGAVIEQLTTAALRDMLIGGLLELEAKVGTGATTPTSGKVLLGTGVGSSAWSDPSAGAIVSGPSASTDGELPLFSGTTGKTLKRSNTLSGFLQLASGVASAAALTLGQITTALGFTPANKAGDTFTGDVTIDKASAHFTVKGTDASPPYITTYDPTDGGWHFITDEGHLYFQSINGAQTFLGNVLSINKTGGLDLQAVGATSQPTIQILNAAAGVQSNIIFYDNGVPKWYVYKRADNVFAIWNSALGADVMQFPVAGGVLVPALVGTGSRMVEASATGVLSAAKIPGMDFLGSGVSTGGGVNLDFLSIFSSTYTHYLILAYIDTLPTSAELYGRLGNAGTFDSAADNYHTRGFLTGNATNIYLGLSSTVMYFLPGSSGTTWQDINFVAWIANPSDASGQTHCNFQIGGIRGGSDWYTSYGSANRKLDKAFTDFRLLSSSSAMGGLKGSAYGMRKT